MKLFLACRNPELRNVLGTNDAQFFDIIMRTDGELIRQHKNRTTIRATIGSQECFIKKHAPTGWLEILKNALRGRWPVLSAQPEWRAIERLTALGIATTPGLAVGCRGRWPDGVESFLVTEALGSRNVRMVHLDELPAKLASLPRRQRARIQRRMMTQVAHIARGLHMHGLNHRDFYLCHFMVADGDWRTWSPAQDTRVHVIDLHRMQVRRNTPQRWIIKDISGLLFSSFDAGLSSRDYLRFLAAYWRCPWRERWAQTRRWRRRVLRRAITMYQAEYGKPPQLPAALASFA